jgi:hypothetical protein
MEGTLLLQHAEQAHFRTPTVAPNPFDFSGHWVNELGSYMDLTVSGSDVTGKYVSAVSDTGGPTPPFDVQGTVSGDLITFYVNWGSEITSWIGHGVIYAGGSVKILTLWHLVQTIKDIADPSKQWKTVLAGADEFHR